MKRSEHDLCRRPAMVTAATLAAAMLMGPILPGCGVGQAPGRPAVLGARARPSSWHPTDPRVIALSGSSGTGVAESIRLISARTGRLVKVIARVGTGNGFALSPDAKSVYVVGVHRNLIVIRRISVATGTITFVADGAYPAVSPDGRYLAYATGRQYSATSFSSLAIRDLRTGRVRLISLARLIGAKSSLLNGGPVTWLGDGTQIVAVPQPDAVATSGSVNNAVASRTATTPCGQQTSPRGLCAIVVDVSAHGLSAHRVFIHPRSTTSATVISGDLAAPHSLLIANWPSVAIDRVNLGGTDVVLRQIARLPKGVLPVAFAPLGDRVLYLVGHTPPALWVATIRDGRLVNRHLLLTDSNRFGIGNVAW
jgi:hypothetical protein